MGRQIRSAKSTGRRALRRNVKRRPPSARRILPAPTVVDTERPTMGAPGLPFPNYTFESVRPRPFEPVRARGGDGGRRGAAEQGVQPAVHLRRRRSRQDAPARRDRAPDAPAQPAAPREVRDERELHGRVHQGGARAAGLSVRRALPRRRRAARRRHPVPRQTRGDADRVLPHVQRAPRERTTDRDRVGPSAAGARDGGAAPIAVPARVCASTCSRPTSRRGSRSSS